MPFDPAAPPAAAVAPAIPPSSASAPGVVVPPAPGEEAQAVAPGAVDPADRAPFRRKRAAVAPPTGRPATIGSARGRSGRLQVRDQVMRNLNNAN